MKKVITILFTIILCLAFVLAVSAEEIKQAENEELRAYIEEKIVPVVIGVATSIVALLGTLKGLFSALRELKRAKIDFEIIAEQNKEAQEKEASILRSDYKVIKESVKDVPRLLDAFDKQQEKIQELERVVVVATEILVLAYSANSELVRTGKAKEMNRLIEKMGSGRGTKEVSEGEAL